MKEAVLGDDLIAMIATLGHDLRGLRDRAILLLGFAGGLRGSELIGLDVIRDDGSNGSGWVENLPGKGLLVTLRGKGDRWRDVEAGCGSSHHTCPVVAPETWIKFGRIARSPIFRRIFKDSKTVDVKRLSDKHVARLVKQTVLAAGIQSDLPDADRGLLFAGHSLRSGLASSAELTRKYQRQCDRLRTDLN